MGPTFAGTCIFEMQSGRGSRDRRETEEEAKKMNEEEKRMVHHYQQLYGTFQASGPYYSQPPPPPGFPQPVPPPSAPAAGHPPPPPCIPYPAHAYCSQGYQAIPVYPVVAEGRPVTLRMEPLPCCGLGIGWILFAIGFFFAFLPWYLGAFILLCVRIDYREKPGLIACTIAAVFSLIATSLGATRYPGFW